MLSNKYCLYVIGLLAGTHSIEGSTGVFAIQNGFIGLAGAIMFVQYMLFFDSWKKFLIALAVSTYLATFICGSRFFSFLCGYLPFLLFSIAVIVLCAYNRKSIALEYEYAKKALNK